MSICNYPIAKPHPRTETPRLYPRSTRRDSHPCFVSFRVRPVSALKSSIEDTTSTLNELSNMCFYELLGIPDTGSLLEIKQAYKQLARKYHPDVSPPDRVDEYTQTFIRVQEAYETLSDPRRRELYDRAKARGFQFAFNSQFDQQVDEKSEWKGRWHSQLSELKRRSMYKDSSDNMSWGARMRKERDESST